MYDSIPIFNPSKEASEDENRILPIFDWVETAWKKYVQENVLK